MNFDQQNATSLAFVGDAVFTLFVRAYLSAKFDYKSGILTKKCADIVSARMQSKILGELEGFLTEEEQAIVKRCRNTHGGGFAKNAGIVEYRRATGFEGLLGYLYLKKEPRLEEILEKSIQIYEGFNE